MRLDEEDLQRIRKETARCVPARVSWRLRVFGSCLQDQARGGDVDIYLETEGLGPSERMEIAYRLRPRIEDALDWPVDLITQDSREPLKDVSRAAREQGVEVGTNAGSS